MSNEINLQEFKMHEKDSGSSSYQIAHLTQRIAHLTDHLSTNKHDFSQRVLLDPCHLFHRCLSG